MQGLRALALPAAHLSNTMLLVHISYRQGGKEGPVCAPVDDVVLVHARQDRQQGSNDLHGIIPSVSRCVRAACSGHGPCSPPQRAAACHYLYLPLLLLTSCRQTLRVENACHPAGHVATSCDLSDM